MNLVVVLGRFTKDPELKYHTDVPICNFTVATVRYFTKHDGTSSSETTYVYCEAWDSGAKAIVDLFKKNDRVLLQGSLKNEFRTTDEGKRITLLKMRVNNFDRLDNQHVEPPVDEE